MEEALPKAQEGLCGQWRHELDELGAQLSLNPT